jgi:hypothetical protein
LLCKKQLKMKKGGAAAAATGPAATRGGATTTNTTTTTAGFGSSNDTDNGGFGNNNISTSAEELDKIRPHPTAALKRFSELMKETPAGQRFIQINKDRVSDFLNKPAQFQTNLDNIMGKEKKRGEETQSYPDALSRLKFQDLPECQRELGVRSRFGDGDGSFFDLWLNSGGALASKQKFDSAGLPVAR